MTPTDDVDFLFTLHGHGWSTARFYVREQVLELSITHIFNDPGAELMQALLALLNGPAKAEVLWYSEPGGSRLTLETTTSHPDKVAVKIQSFYKDVLELPKDEDGYEPLATFEIGLKHLLTLVYLQLRKSFVLLQEKSYAATRQKDFPFAEFHRFERLVSAHPNLTGAT